MPSSPRSEHPLIRMFPDYAESVLWFGGPIPYPDTGLSSGLVEDLNAWEQRYYDALTQDFDWVSPDLAGQFTAAGNALAQRLADELGEDFVIEFRSYEPNTAAHRFSGSGAALNRQAASTMGALLAERAAELEFMERARTRGSGPWQAYAPMSKTTFRSQEGAEE